MWKQTQVRRFRFEGREALVVVPEGPANGRLVWKAEYFGAFPNFEEALVERGYHLCFIAHENRWAPEEEIQISARFLRHVAETYGLDKRCVAVGMSCGGLLSVRLAQTCPELVGVLYLDAPVLNLLSMAGLGEAEFRPDMFREMVAAYGFDRSTIVAFRDSPIDHMAILLKSRIPVLMLYGNADMTVIYEENGRLLERYYQAHGLPLKVISRSACGHHPHSLDDPAPMIDFVESHMINRTEPAAMERASNRQMYRGLI